MLELGASIRISSVRSLGSTPQVIAQLLRIEVGMGFELPSFFGIECRATSLLCLLPR